MHDVSFPAIHAFVLFFGKLDEGTTGLHALFFALVVIIGTTYFDSRPAIPGSPP